MELLSTTLEDSTASIYIYIPTAGPGVFSSISKDEVRIIDVAVAQRLDGGDVDDQRPSASLYARLVSWSPS